MDFRLRDLPSGGQAAVASFIGRHKTQWYGCLKRYDEQPDAWATFGWARVRPEKKVLSTLRFEYKE
ncbi:hypothetical protein ESY86_16175 [Subsaximicrobium wynnwilliamsii]|uniref:Uncharacterized protein n=1 Tax=Subsaximicrobium wynnwilliamsii TaxID=291179 RepID=A0A5C6ZD36_9FLAO|nr:hypothetical protein [Subsaximicrobium wynnwilliamsii]TXD81747.1 hypothetical protein ESY87_16670 [Subsaximicrobium wynnwilliamsii]TXD87573.1 hypothetical protein ESY86_16175 [Subsaximicrobium wynnwilliamsii]TXE01246.1 hypothetical protein ESY88_16425 [Subsaximicrobium wynnwilliamsii]